MTSRTPWLILAVGLLLSTGLGSMAAPDVFSNWLKTQDDIARRIHVEAKEQTERRVTGPFGERRFNITARLKGVPYETRWRRDVDDNRPKDRPPQPPQGRPQNERRRGSPERSEFGSLRSEIEDVVTGLTLSGDWLRTLRPVRRPDRVRLDNTSAVRYEMKGPETEKRSLTATFWFDARDPRLRRTLIRIELPSGDLATITTDYERHSGIDLASERRVEALVQHRRRIRTFTTEINTRTRYTDVAVRR